MKRPCKFSTTIVVKYLEQRKREKTIKSLATGVRWQHHHSAKPKGYVLNVQWAEQSQWTYLPSSPTINQTSHRYLWQEQNLWSKTCQHVQEKATIEAQISEYHVARNTRYAMVWSTWFQNVKDQGKQLLGTSNIVSLWRRTQKTIIEEDLEDHKA